MKNVEVIQVKNFRRKEQGYQVQVTFREPFAYFFEIAQHTYFFTDKAKAERLALRVENAIREDRKNWRSISNLLDNKYWNYVSSEYDRHKAPSNALVFV